MGLDLYTGTLTRYFSGQWKTAGQRACEAAGLPYRIAYPGGVAPWLDLSAARSGVEAFRGAISTQWGPRFPFFQQTPSWNEAAETPYLADKPDHDGVRSLVLVAAYLERPDLQRPVLMPEPYDSDPAYDEAHPRGYYMGNMVVLECQLFLPGSDNYVIVVEDPLGRKRFTTSIGMLRGAIDDIASRAWGAEPQEIAGWYDRGSIRFGPTQTILEADTDGRREMREERTEVHDQLEHNAQYGLACFRRAYAFALEHDVPIVVDQ